MSRRHSLTSDSRQGYLISSHPVTVIASAPLFAKRLVYAAFYGASEGEHSGSKAVSQRMSAARLQGHRKQAGAGLDFWKVNKIGLIFLL